MTHRLARRRQPPAPRVIVLALLAVATLAAPAGAAASDPVNVVAPTVVGEALEGARLFSDDGVWSGNVVRLSRRWQRQRPDVNRWIDIAGADRFTYVVGPNDVGTRLRLKVSATGFGGTVSAVSVPTAIVRARPTPTATPTPSPTPSPTPTPTSTPAATATPAPTVAPPVVLPAALEPPLIAFPRAAFAGGLSSVTVTWGGRPAISGEVVRPDGRPVAGARLWLTSRLEMRDAVPVTLGWVSTDDTGRFAYTPSAEPSRALTFAFADSAALRTATVTIRVRPRIALRFTQGGTIAGRVAGAPFGTEPRVELQSRVGPLWRTFSTTRLSPLDGTFASRPRKPPRRVRVLIRASPSWPFETGTSAAVTRAR